MERVLCVGSVTTDVIVTPVDTLPPPGVLQAVRGTTTHVGGCASNAAIDLAKLGAPASLSCRVGQDSFGDFVAATVSQAGVDASGIVRDPKVSTTSSVVLVHSDGERSFLYNPGSTSSFSAQDVRDEDLQACGILFVAGAMLLSSFDGEPCAGLLRKAKQMGKFTVMDTAWDFEDRWMEKIAPSLPYLDLFMPSYEEAARLSGEKDPARIADVFFQMGAKSVIIKLGKDGAYFCEPGGDRYTLPTYRAIKPVDTTGAGDSFCAGFLCGLAQGWDYRRSGAFANAVGTHCIMEVGASTGIKPMAEILDFMARTPLE